MLISIWQEHCNLSDPVQVGGPYYLTEMKRERSLIPKTDRCLFPSPVIPSERASIYLFHRRFRPPFPHPCLPSQHLVMIVDDSMFTTLRNISCSRCRTSPHLHSSGCLTFYSTRAQPYRVPVSGCSVNMDMALLGCLEIFK